MNKLLNFLFPWRFEIELLRKCLSASRAAAKTADADAEDARYRAHQLVDKLDAERARSTAARDWLNQLLPAERAEVLRGFVGYERDNQLLTAVRSLVENARSEATELALAPEMARCPGEAAHAAGGAYWLDLLANRIQTAWIESRTGNQAAR